MLNQEGKETSKIYYKGNNMYDKNTLYKFTLKINDNFVYYTAHVLEHEQGFIKILTIKGENLILNPLHIIRADILSGAGIDEKL